MMMSASAMSVAVLMSSAPTIVVVVVMSSALAIVVATSATATFAAHAVQCACHLLGCGIATFKNVPRKVEVAACEGMVQIHAYHVVAHFAHNTVEA